MKTKKLWFSLLALLLVFVFAASSVTAFAASTGTTTTTQNSGSLGSGKGGTPPSGGNGGTPPSMPSGSAPSGSPPGGAAPGENAGADSSSYTLTGTYTDNGKETVYSGSSSISSTKSGQNVVIAENSAKLTMKGVTLTKTGDDKDNNATDFYSVNAVVSSASGSAMYLSNATINSNAQGANCLFATGENSKLYVYNTKVTSTKDSSRGIDATMTGTVIGDSLDISTAGAHCAALATDRGGGSVSVANSTLKTSGNGSPLVYSTGTIEVNNVSGTATGSQIVGMEGLNTVRIKNSTLTGANAKASEPICNGVIIYQSTSGDSSNGTATFEASNSTLKSNITSGSMFYITNTTANILLQKSTLDFDSNNCYLLYAAGNDASNGWGTKGSNGGKVTFTALDETLNGNVLCDGISTVKMYLSGSTWSGAVVNDTTYTGSGGVSIYLGDGAVWNVTKKCTVKNLYISSGATINGLDNVTVTGTKSTDYDGSGAGTISAFTIDRTAFNSFFNITNTAVTNAVTSSNTASAAKESKSGRTLYIVIGALLVVASAVVIMIALFKRNKKRDDGVNTVILPDSTAAGGGSFPSTAPAWPGTTALNETENTIPTKSGQAGKVQDAQETSVPAENDTTQNLTEQDENADSPEKAE